MSAIMCRRCLICGEQITTRDKRRRYCSDECARRAKISQNNEYNKRNRDKKRIKWAYNEAEKISNIAFIMGSNYMDELADYIYNNYKQRRKTK